MKKLIYILLTFIVLLLTLHFSTYKVVKTELRSSYNLEGVYPFRTYSLEFKDGLKANCKKNSRYWFFASNQEKQIKLTYYKNIFGFISVEAI